MDTNEIILKVLNENLNWTDMVNLTERQTLAIKIKEQLRLCGVSNRRGLLIDFAEKVYRCIYFTWDKETSEKVVDEYIKGNL
jgi:phosphopantetheine adenylyltransferase